MPPAVMPPSVNNKKRSTVYGEALDVEPDICGELARNNFVFDGLRQNETFSDLLSCYSPS
ncbi:MAG UNVERIFIED_CONTAM: hypothetical protein LVR29_10955 [Microcystis novacekii LVE1205-3]|jgi:hypothetical protein